MSLKLLYFIIIINQIYLLHTSQIVSLPFNSFFKYGYRTNITSIDDLSRMNLYSKINIGEPLYEIKTFLSVQHSYFSFFNFSLNSSSSIFKVSKLIASEEFT